MKRGLQMKRTWVAGLTGALFIFGLLLPASTPAAADKILLGYAETLSGEQAKAGALSSWGVKASVKWINDVQGGVKIGGKKVPLEVKLYDNESKKEGATSLIERLVTVDKADAIIAPYTAGLTMAGAPIAEKYRKVYLSHGGSSNRIFEQGFRYAVLLVTPASDFQVGALDMFHKVDPKAKKIALVFEDDEFARMAYQGAEEHAKKLGYEVVFKRTYPNNVTDLTPLLSDLKGSKPDLILGGGHFADGQLFTRQLADLDINVKGFSLIVAVTLPAFYEALGAKAEGVVGPAQWEFGVKYNPEEAKKAGQEWYGPTNEEWVKLVKGFSGAENPNYHAAEAGAAPLIYARAVELANSLDSDKVRDALSKLNLMTYFGGFKIDGKTGLQTGHSMVTVQWQNEKRIIVWPPEAATDKLYYPMPTFAEKAGGKKATAK
jgi:branched-chain amino acid transport system substrate-binding protein